MQRALDLALQRFDRIDIAFNNAGILGALKPTHQISQTEWENTLNTNLSANFYAAQMQLNAMLQQKNGCILFTSTFVGHRIGFPNMAAYAASSRFNWLNSGDCRRVWRLRYSL
jgi:NADP-dependent 3-hydroxy acid dehydrogenase YdfG